MPVVILLKHGVIGYVLVGILYTVGFSVIVFRHIGSRQLLVEELVFHFLNADVICVRVEVDYIIVNAELFGERAKSCLVKRGVVLLVFFFFGFFFRQFRFVRLRPVLRACRACRGRA